jgi:hypothetical protein
MIETQETWFAEKGDFWGTIRQLTHCARCGRVSRKRYDEPRHFADIFKPTAHHLCDGCYESLPSE